ncbi:hypothetical protein AIOL_003429 [Candidatus Rhodobacter oscarellae]|uniref:Uncharacterized protein n=1 Tax=Candidatus Rhodobacter oscarellae TaxID=1675527 RepID=A0A0J9E9V9_9RHOB|nr:succinyl-CoA synthetase subunit beta [Candidatus Rhodobacter lobularis]KMW58454.1 hypothetical protein AIOL_003429 [Candidatus Rhodobacter lobularis]
MTREKRYRVLNLLFAGCMVLAMLGSAALSGPVSSAARHSVEGFAAHCFSPLMTAAKAAEAFDGLRYEFYDLDPFRASNPVSAPVKAPVTPGTDRRCEVSFDGAHTKPAIDAVLGALVREGIKTEADLPATFQATDGTALLAARRLNPRKIAVVHVGTRPGPNGVETFMNVERLPLAENR